MRLAVAQDSRHRLRACGVAAEDTVLALRVPTEPQITRLRDGILGDWGRRVRVAIILNRE